MKKVYKYLEEFKNEPHYLASVNAFLSGIKEENISEDDLLVLITPNHIIEFDMEWTDDLGKKHTEKGWRVQHSNKLGVYKGGIRFSNTVTLDILKALAFEQTLKNSLTGLPLGGAKGGSTFDPTHKSENEIKRFIKTFMEKLSPILGSNVDVPAGDLGVGQKEVTLMQKEYERVLNTKDMTFTSKLINYSGSHLRSEATGYGLCYMVNEALKSRFGTTIRDKTVIISGSGNVGLHAAFKARELGAKVIGVSDISGTIYDDQGIDLTFIKTLKANKESFENYLVKHKHAKYSPYPKALWEIKADIVLPCATQDEINAEDAAKIVSNKPLLIAEGSNLGLTLKAVEYLVKKEILFIPGKAANSGGVAVSYFEMLQNKEGVSWSESEVDTRLKDVMKNVFRRINEYALKHNYPYDLKRAADIVALLTLLK
ncbi:MAG: Glu/Leu/Phe/Val dehydrogenase dimerization domain-containing protein [Bacilli bacterium]|jgi:glutamate dehydrogenase (NADP+)